MLFLLPGIPARFSDFTHLTNGSCSLIVFLSGGQRLQMMRVPPIAPPLPRPPPPPPMMLPPALQGPSPQGPPQPMSHVAAAPQVRAQRSRTVFDALMSCWCVDIPVDLFLCLPQLGDMVSMAPTTRQGAPPSTKQTPSIIQAAPTVYSALPAPVGHKRVDVRAQRQARMVFAFRYSSVLSYGNDVQQCGSVYEGCC